MKANPKNVRFSDLERVCETYFGTITSRQKGSHKIYWIPIKGRPPINIQQGNGGVAKPYQVRQVIQTIEEFGLTKE
jgi:hypothetical protein